jgi:RNA polymerase sigma-70 factor (ECF subfamily)
MRNIDDLVYRCQQGERAAFNALFRAYERDIYRLAASILRDEHEAEDAMQDVFLRVFQRIGQYRREASFKTWLTTVIVNVCRDRLRRRKVRQTISLAWLRDRSDSEARDLTEIVHERWQKQRLWAQVDRLDEKYRLPILLIYQENLSVQETAQALRLPASTLYSRLNKALAQLRSMQAAPPDRESGHVQSGNTGAEKVGAQKIGKEKC